MFLNKKILEFATILDKNKRMTSHCVADHPSPYSMLQKERRFFRNAQSFRAIKIGTVSRCHDRFAGDCTLGSDLELNWRHFISICLQLLFFTTNASLSPVKPVEVESVQLRCFA